MHLSKLLRRLADGVIRPAANPGESGKQEYRKGNLPMTKSLSSCFPVFLIRAISLPAFLLS
jgi:hypothetical protein